MILQRAKGSGGVYHYFFCRGRQGRECDEPYLNVDRRLLQVDQVRPGVRRCRAPGDVRDTRRRAVGEPAPPQAADRAGGPARHPGVESDRSGRREPKQKVRQKLRAIERERERIRARLDGVDTEIMGGGLELLEVVLSLLERPDELHRRGNRRRKASDQPGAQFEKLHIYPTRSWKRSCASGLAISSRRMSDTASVADQALK